MKEAELALEGNDVKRMEKAVSLLDRIDDPYIESRVNQLCGDLFRRNKNYRRAILFYSKSNLARPDGNKSSLYGLIECYREIKDHENFAEILDVYLSHPGLPPLQIARCAVAAAELDDTEKVQKICALIEENPETDVRTCIALARAFAMIGNSEKKDLFSRKARALVKNDQSLLLEISSIDYAPPEYWEIRYSGPQGYKAGVATSSHSKEAYNTRLKRDVSFLENIFVKYLAKKSLMRALDAGCGSGRLSEFLANWVKQLDSVDISESAIQIARSRNTNLKNTSYDTCNILSHYNKDNDKDLYDLIVDFNTTQSIANDNDWKQIFILYHRLTKKDGYLILVEADGSRARKTQLNISRKTPEDYISTAENSGLTAVESGKTNWGECYYIFKK